MLEIWTTESGQLGHIAVPGDRKTYCGKSITRGWDLWGEVPNLHHVAKVCQSCVQGWSARGQS